VERNPQDKAYGRQVGPPDDPSGDEGVMGYFALGSAQGYQFTSNHPKRHALDTHWLESVGLRRLVSRRMGDRRSGAVAWGSSLFRGRVGLGKRLLLGFLAVNVLGVLIRVGVSASSATGLEETTGLGTWGSTLALYLLAGAIVYVVATREGANRRRAHRSEVMPAAKPPAGSKPAAWKD
jgi:hypothetical protein